MTTGKRPEHEAETEITRAETKHPYVPIRRDILNDYRLSIAARGALLHLLYGDPDLSTIKSEDQLLNAWGLDFPEGRTQIFHMILRELEEAGYILIVRDSKTGKTHMYMQTGR